MFLGHQRVVLEPWRHVKSIFSKKNFDLKIPLQTPFLAWAALELQKCFKNMSAAFDDFLFREGALIKTIQLPLETISPGLKSRGGLKF